MKVSELITILSAMPQDAEVEIAVRSRINPRKRLRRKVITVSRRKRGDNTTVFLVALKSLAQQNQLLKEQQQRQES